MGSWEQAIEVPPGEAWSRLLELLASGQARAERLARAGKNEPGTVRARLRELLTITAAADVGGGQVIIVDPDNAGLVSGYAANGLLNTGGPDLRMYMKVATTRAYLQ